MPGATACISLYKLVNLESHFSMHLQQFLWKFTWCTFQFNLLRICVCRHQCLVEKDSNWYIVFSLYIQDWKTGDRVLAKWQDCKFYPAKITKCLSDGKKPLNTLFEKSLVGCPSNSSYTRIWLNHWSAGLVINW